MWKLILPGATLGAIVATGFIIWESYSQMVAVQDVSKNHSTPEPNFVRVDTEYKNTNEIARLEKQLKHLKDQVDAMHVRQSPSGKIGPKTSNKATGSESDYVNAIAEERFRTQQTVQFLEDQFLADPLDPGWASYAESEVANSLMYSEEDSSRLEGVHCQSTLCKLSVSHEGSEAELNFMTGLGQMDSFKDGHAFVQRVEHNDGSVDTLVFVSRAGYELPPMAVN